MNERIRELAINAGMIRMNQRSDGLYVVGEEVFDNFAELIVQDCVDIIQRESDKAIRNNTYMGDDVPASVTQVAIKEHFGV